MSEYTDYFLVRADSADAVIAKLSEAGAHAIVFDDLPAGAAAPVWVPVALGSGIEPLPQIGTTIHFRLDEDGIGWQLSIVGEQDWLTYSFFDRQFWYIDNQGRREAPDGFRPVEPCGVTASDLNRYAEVFGTTKEALAATLRAGGFDNFIAVTGLPYFDMLDQDLILNQHSMDGPAGVVAASRLGDCL